MYENYLEHKLGWTKKNHKYIRREKAKNHPGYKYYYRLGDPNSDNSFSYTSTVGPKAKVWDSNGKPIEQIFDKRPGDKFYQDAKKEYSNIAKTYGGDFKLYSGSGDNPIGAVRDSYQINLKNGDMKQAQRDAKVLRSMKEETPKAKLSNALLKIKISERVLKTKLKDIFN